MAISIAPGDRPHVFSAGLARWPYRVLAVEAGSPVLPPLSEDGLSDAGIELTVFRDGASALMCMSTEDPAVVLAPTEIRGVDFLCFVETVLKFSTVPVIVGVTSDQGSQERAYEAIRRGAHGLIALPAEPNQILTLTQRFAAPRSAFSAPRTFGSISLDPQAHRVEAGGAPVSLSVVEFAVLERLMRAAPAMVAKEDLMEIDVGDGRLTLQHLRSVIYRLRGKLAAAAPDQPDCIEAVRPLGYRLGS